MTRVAAVDCGTNSVRLLIADRTGGRLTDVRREMRIVRLGEGVDNTGMLAPQAIERTRVALVDYAELMGGLDVDRVRMVATSASRDATNRADFVAMVQATLGVEPEVITGDAEARLSFAGATSGLPDAEPPVLVVDIGGGSTEFVLGSSTVDSAVSVNIGCVRLTERHLHDDPPSAAQVQAATEDVRAGIARARQQVDFAAARTVVGVAGTVTTITALALQLPHYDAERIHGTWTTASQVREIAAALLSATRDERADLPSMHPGRVDVIGAGALVWQEIVAATGAEQVLTSEHDILDGIALSLG